MILMIVIPRFFVHLNIFKLRYIENDQIYYVIIIIIIIIIIEKRERITEL
jgi:hypothetical protein